MMNEFRPIRSTADRAPETEIEALMITKPFEEPVESSENLLPLREAVVEHVERLLPRELWVINAIYSEGKSLQKIADELGITKTHVWRIRNQTLEKLRGEMSMDTTIRQSVKLADTWDGSATQWVIHLASNQKANGKSGFNISEIRTLVDEAVKLLPNNPSIQGVIETIAQLTIGEMRNRESWDSGYMIETLCRKQHDYGHGNINRFGLMGVLVRMSDKVERFTNLGLTGRKAMNESTHDTLLDIVGYSVIALMLLDDTFNLQLGEEYTHGSHA